MKYKNENTVNWSSLYGIAELQYKEKVDKFGERLIILELGTIFTSSKSQNNNQKAILFPKILEYTHTCVYVVWHSERKR